MDTSILWIAWVKQPRVSEHQKFVVVQFVYTVSSNYLQHVRVAGRPGGGLRRLLQGEDQRPEEQEVAGEGKDSDRHVPPRSRQ